MAPRTSPQPPAVDRVVLPPLADTTPGEVGGGDSRECERYHRADFAGHSLGFTTFSECEFAGASLDDTDLRSVHFIDCLLSDVDAAVFAAPRSQWRRVPVQRSRLGSLEVYQGVWRSVAIEDSKLTYVNARGATWQDVIFKNCVIEELDLGASTVTRMSFEGCRIDTLDLTQAKLCDVDLRGADLHIIKGLSGMAGAWISEEQLTLMAPLLAAELQINVD